MKRFLPLLAAFILIFCLAASPALAEDFVQFEYEDMGESIRITGCAEGASGKVSIPAQINGKPVSIIGSSAFLGCEYIEEILLPDSVEKIEPYAFYGCASLKRINLPATPEVYGEGLFSGCAALEYVTLPKELDKISDNMFYGCTSLRRISIPAGVKSIGDNAFAGCESLRHRSAHRA